jgi:hypothetical protein
VFWHLGSATASLRLDPHNYVSCFPWQKWSRQFLLVLQTSLKMKQRTPLVLSALLSLAAAVPAPESNCNDDCLLKLIRYREEANVDWLMALGYCPVLLGSPAGRMRLDAVAPPAEATSSILPLNADEDITVTTTVTTTATTSTTTTLSNTLQRRLDSHSDNRCERYRFRERPQPTPWHGHSELEIRKACSRILHRTVQPAPARTAFVRPMVLSVSPVVVGDSTEFVTLTVYTTITAGSAPGPVTRFQGEAVKTVVRSETAGSGVGKREFSCDGAFAECCTGRGGVRMGTWKGLDVSCSSGFLARICADFLLGNNNLNGRPVACSAESPVGLCCSVVFVSAPLLACRGLN